MKNILLLDAGDLFFERFSSPYPNSKLAMATEKAHLILESFNRIRYDAIGVGDDDLSLGKKFLVEVSKRAQFPFLSSNLMDEESGTLLFQPYLLKEMNGLRIGIFSVISPDTFLGPSDPRIKGLVFRDPFETVRAMVNELGPQTDFLILLSHLGYPKDVQLAQAVSGIDVIVGAHTAQHLVVPSVIKDTVIVQMAAKGMFAGRLDLTIVKKKGGFFNIAAKYALEGELKNLHDQLISTNVPEPEKVHLRRTKAEIEQQLKQLEGKNFFSHILTPLDEQFEEDLGIMEMIDAFKKRFR